MSESRAGAAFAEAVTVAEVLCMIVVIAFGAWLIAGGDAQLGTLIALTGYLGYLYPQIQALGGLLVEVTSATASAERVAEVLDAPAGVAEPIAPESLAPEPGVTDPIPGRRPVSPAPVGLSLTGVSFAYPDNGSRVLEDAHLEIRAGETVAVTGPSGAGKSTLTRLLLRLYDPDAGSIRLNGTDIRHLDVSDLREHLSVLHQRPALMRGTIADNIRFGCTTATRADIAAAARAAGAAEFISRMNGGLDAEVVERGENLSGGQQQRIALARTILRHRPVSSSTNRPRASTTRPSAGSSNHSPGSRHCGPRSSSPMIRVCSTSPTGQSSCATDGLPMRLRWRRGQARARS